VVSPQKSHPLGGDGMRLWVDDERPGPKGWTQVFTAHAAMLGLLSGGVCEMSVDHDLGFEKPTGYDLLYCMARLKLKVPKIAVHSANPVGAEAMRNLIEQFELEEQDV